MGVRPADSVSKLKTVTNDLSINILAKDEDIKPINDQARL